MTRLTFVGALYITAVCLLPEFLILYWNVPFTSAVRLIDYRSRSDGFHGADTVAPDVAPVRRHYEKSQS